MVRNNDFKLLLSTGSLCVINHNGQKHQEEEDGASNCKMMKGKVPIMSWLIMGTFPFIFIQNQMCFVVVVVQLLKLNQFSHDLVAGVATKQATAESPWNHSNLHRFKSSQRSCEVLTRVQLTALSPAQTNQTWQANSSDLIWTAPHKCEHWKKPGHTWRHCEKLFF